MKKLFAALLLTASIPAQAALIQIDITGNLYQVSNSVSSVFSIGDAVTAQLLLDTGSAGSPSGSEAYYYADAVVGGFISVNGYTATFSNDARAFVTDQEFGGLMDRFLIDDYLSSAASVNGLPFYDLFLNWQDNSATASQGFALPGTQSAVDAYGLPVGGIDWLTNDGQNRITFATTQLTVTSVPEPASWAMMIGGFAIAGAAMRRRKVAVSFA